MPYAYPTVSLGGNNVEVYQATADVDAYMATRMGSDPWDDLDAAVKDKVNASAGLVLDRRRWKGTKTDAANAHAHPRTDLVDREGEDINSATIAPEVLEAHAELCLAIASDSTIGFETSAASGSNVRSVGAGTASVEFFAPEAQQRLPLPVMDLISHLLGSSTATPSPGSRAYAAGDDNGYSDEGSDCDRYDRNDPLG